MQISKIPWKMQSSTVNVTHLSSKISYAFTHHEHPKTKTKEAISLILSFMTQPLT